MTCTCGHSVLTHHLTPTQHRTWCSTFTPAGPCPCQQFEESQ